MSSPLKHCLYSRIPNPVSDMSQNNDASQTHHVGQAAILGVFHSLTYVTVVKLFHSGARAHTHTPFLPDVRSRQRLQLSGEEELSVSQLMFLFLWQVHHLRVLHLLLHLSCGSKVKIHLHSASSRCAFLVVS